MALHGLININRHNIGQWSAARITTNPDGLHTYEWTVEVNGVQHVGASAVLAAYAQRQENP